MEHKKVSAQTAALCIVALFFLTGVIAGCIFSAKGGVDADQAITGYLSGFANLPVGLPSMSRVLSDTLLYPALCFLLGFAVPGFVLIPLVISARGFFLAYTVASCVRVFGAWEGFLFSASLVGLPALFSLPCLVILGAQGMLSSYALCRAALRKSTPASVLPGKNNFIRFGVSVCALTAGAVCEMFICPLLIGAVTSVL